MTDINIAICDDLMEERATLRRMLLGYFREKGLGARMRPFASGEELLSALEEGKRFDIFFLDIYMPGLSGVETARRIRRMDQEAAIIFVTASTEHGMESFELGVSDYLVKPIGEEDVARSLDWFFAHPPEGLRKLSVCAGRERVDIPLSSILYIEVLDHRAHIHTQREVIVIRRKLEDLIADINSEDFLRCHRSYLVNMNHIQSVKNADFCVTGGDLVPISTRDLTRHQSRFIDWAYKKAWGQR